MEEILKLVLEVEAEGIGSVKKDIIKMAKDFDKEFSKSLSDLTKLEKSMSDAMENAAKKSQKKVSQSISESVLGGWEQASKGITGVVTKSLDAGISALKSPKQAGESLAKGMFTGLGKVGDKISKMMGSKGKSMMGGDTGKTSKMLGGILRTLGPAVGMISTLVGALGRVVSLLIDAEAQAKDLNSTLLEGGIAGGDLASNMWDVRPALDSLRKSAVDFNNNMQWGTVAKDQIEIINAFNEAGFTVREMTDDITDSKAAMQDYQDATKTALTYSKLLGMSTKEVASAQAKYMESMGSSLAYVEEQFNAIYKTSQLSGFGVKRFTGMVQQATSGMAMYNVRIDEAAGLLLRLGSVLSPEKAGEFIQTLNKGFAGEGMTERFKRVMTTGADKMKEIFENSADDIAFDFGKKLANSGAGEVIAGQLSEAGIDVDFGTEEGRKDVIKGLANLKPGEQAKLLAEIRAEDAGMARELSKLMKVSEGTKGGMNNLAEGMAGLDMGGTLAAQLNQANAVIGKPLHEMNAMQMAAFENITGISGEQRELLAEVSQGLHGNYQVLEDMSYDNMSQAEIAKEQLRQAETYGAITDKNGKIFRATVDEQTGELKKGEEIEDLGEYIQSQGDMIARATEVGLDKNTAVAQEIARNTTSVSKILEMGVQYWLERIYELIAPLVSFSMGGKDPSEVKAELEAIDKMTKGYEEKSLKLAEEMGDLQAKLAAASGTDKEAVEAQIKAKEEEIKQNQAQLEIQRQFRKSVERSTFEGGDAERFSEESVLRAVTAAYGEEQASSVKTQIDQRMRQLSRAGATEKQVASARSEAFKRFGTELGRGSEIEDIMPKVTSGAHLKFDVESEAAKINPSEDLELARNLMPISAAMGEVGPSDEAYEQTRRNIRQSAKAQQRRLSLEDLAGGILGRTTEGKTPEEIQAMAEDMGLTAEQMEDLLGYSKDGLDYIGDQSNQQLVELTKMAHLLPDETKRDRELKKLAKYIQEEESKNRLRRAFEQSISNLGMTSQMSATGAFGTERGLQFMPPEMMAEYKRTFGLTEAQDFIYRPGRPPMAFSDQDTVIGTKPGGAFGGLGGDKTVNLNVYGSQAEIYNMVRKVLNEYGFG